MKTTQTILAVGALLPTAVLAAEGEVTGVQQWTAYLQQGGLTMAFIGLLSVLGLACALERLVHLRRSRISPEGLCAQAIELGRKRNNDGLTELLATNPCTFSSVLEDMLATGRVKTYNMAMRVAEDKAARELKLEAKKSAMLGTVATIAPLLGLFGTVVGLLGAFGTVAMMGEMGDASVLADDIGKALVTTVGGLAVSMPALFAHNYFRNKLSYLSVILEQDISNFIVELFPEG